LQYSTAKGYIPPRDLSYYDKLTQIPLELAFSFFCLTLSFSPIFVIFYALGVVGVLFVGSWFILPPRGPRAKETPALPHTNRLCRLCIYMVDSRPFPLASYQISCFLVFRSRCISLILPRHESLELLIVLFSFLRNTIILFTSTTLYSSLD
jgi:hypothetical protein